MLIFEVDELVAGYPKGIAEGNNYVFWIPSRYTADINKMIPSLNKMEKGSDYLIRAFHRPYGDFAVRDLEVPVQNAFRTLNLKALDGKNLWYIKVGKDERLNLNLPEYHELKLEVDRLNENLRATLLIGSSDMSAMPDMQVDTKRNFLVEGRWLNHDDELNANKAMVISKQLAESEKIKLGDNITLTVRNLKDPFHAYIRAREDIENWQVYPSQKITYEVVGIYSSSEMEASFRNQNYYSNSYVPKSTLPMEFVLPDYSSGIKDIHPAYSFVLNNPKNQDAFIAEYGSKLNEAGFTLKFSDNNGRNFKAGADPLRKSTLIGLLLFTLALLIATAFSVFLYLRQHRANYAILRALGVPAKDCNKQLIVPLLALGVIGSGIGTILSWKIAHAKALESISRLPLPSGTLPELNLQVIWGWAFWFFIICVVITGAYIGNRKVSSMPVLELLQNSASKVKQDTRHLEKEPKKQLLFNQNLANNAITGNLRGRENQNKAMIRFMRLNIIRAKSRTLLTIFIAAALLLAMGWLQSLIVSNANEINQLYKNSPVQVDLTGPESIFTLHTIPLDLVDWMESSEFIQDEYLSKVFRLPSKFDKVHGTFSPYPPYTILAINSMEHALDTRTAEMLEIDFATGVGPEVFSEIWMKKDIGTRSIPIIVPKQIMEEQNWDLGAEIKFGLKESTEEIPFVIQGTFEKIALVLGDAGTTMDGKFVAAGYCPMLSNLSALELYTPNASDYFEVVFYTEPQMNRRLNEFKLLLEEKKEELGGYASQTTVKFWDEELLAVIEPMEKNLSLMEKLYPFTMLISGLIGGTLSFLLILNQSKEATMLRMLGLSKKSTRVIQIAQTFALSLLGVGLGVVLVGIIRGSATIGLPLLWAILIYLAGMLIGSLIATFINTKRQPMGLLQVKA